jgi:aspartate aminotransferase
MAKEFTSRRQKMLELLAGIPGIKCSEPDGAFYVFPVVKEYFGKKHGSEVLNNADDLAMYLLNTAHVSTVTGSAFGEPTCIRLSFANSMKNIENGLARIKDALAKLN